MKVSAKTEYACLAMLQLAAQHGSGKPLRVREIAEVHGIPSRFLVQILLQLKGAGYVTSTRGASGGYRLLKPPEKISLGEIMTTIEGPRDEGLPSGTPADTPIAQTLLGAWQEIAGVAQSKLDELTLADLVEQADSDAQTMYYI